LIGAAVKSPRGLTGESPRYLIGRSRHVAGGDRLARLLAQDRHAFLSHLPQAAAPA
jgi:hypothetical protein